MTAAGWLAVATAGAAGAVVLADPVAPLRRLVPAAPGPVRHGAAHVLLAGGAVLAVVTAARSWVLAAVVVVALVTVRRSVARRAARRRAEAVRAATCDLLGALSAELRAGAEPRAALALVCAGAVPAVAAAARSPASAAVPGALVAAAREPGAEVLADLAAAWRVVAVTGAGLAGVVDRLAAAAQADSALRREVAAQLAGPRAAGALLFALPGAGVLLGAALGADPVGFLVGTPPGRACLLAGVLLAAVGTGWIEAVAARAERG